MYMFGIQNKVKNGIIQLPKRLKGTITNTVKVIILKEDPTPLPSNAGSDMIERRLASPLEIKGFQPLKRDEIHAR